MSFLKEIKLRHEVYYPKINIQSIDLEFVKNIQQKVRALLENIIKFFKYIFSWIKTKVLVWLNSRSIARLTNDITKLQSIRYFNDKELNEIIHTYFNSPSIENYTKEDMVGVVGNARSITHLYTIITTEGKLFNLDTIINAVEEYGINLENSNFDKVYIGNENNRGIIIAAEVNGWDVNERIKPKQLQYLPTISKNELFKYIDLIDTLKKKASQFYHQKEKSITLAINNYSQKLNTVNDDSNTEDIKNRIVKLNGYLKAVIAPLGCIITYIRLIEYINKSLSSETYTTTTDIRFNKLYHLSNQYLGDIVEFKPSIRPSMVNQPILPPRISFSETIEGCLHGLSDLLIYPQHEEYRIYKYHNNIEQEFQLYEGIPDKDTRYIKPEIVAHYIGEYFYSKEICVVTPIKLKNIGKIKVVYDPHKPLYDLKKIKHIERI